MSPRMSGTKRPAKGDVVQLHSCAVSGEGPLLTAGETSRDMNGDWSSECVWMDSRGQLQQARIPCALLRVVGRARDRNRNRVVPILEDP